MTIKNVLAFGLITFFLYACKKTEVNNCVTDWGNPSDAEVANVKSWLTSKNIVATEDTAGFFYRIGFAGDGTDYPVVSDSVTVKYKGMLTDGSVFDSTVAGVTSKFPLWKLITGWQVGLPLIKKGGIIDLYLPPSHGYGCRGQYTVPANATLIFHIELIDF